MDGELDFQNVNNQIQPYLFEALASGHYSSDNYFRESESASDNGDQCQPGTNWASRLVSL